MMLTSMEAVKNLEVGSEIEVWSTGRGAVNEVWSVMIEVWSKLSVVNRKGRNRKGTRPSHHMLMSEGLRMGGCGLKECGVRQK